LGRFQVGGMAHYEIEVTGVVRGAVYAAAISPDFLVGKMGGDEAADFFQMLWRERERGIRHVFGEAFRRGRARRAGTR